MEAASPEKLLEAFKVLDVDAKGYLTKEYISKVMMQDGEPFTQVDDKNFQFEYYLEIYETYFSRKNWMKCYLLLWMHKAVELLTNTTLTH